MSGSQLSDAAGHRRSPVGSDAGCLVLPQLSLSATRQSRAAWAAARPLRADTDRDRRQEGWPVGDLRRSLSLG